MNKYLLMSAAAVLASTAGANAGTALHSFQFGTASGGSYCDGGTVYSSGTGVWSWQHTNNDCYGSVSYGQGLVGKLAVVGKAADMSDGIFGNSIFTINFTLPKKLAAGHAWTLWCQFSGTSSFQCNSGVLINVVPNSKAHKSTVTALKSLMQAHRSAARKS